MSIPSYVPYVLSDYVYYRIKYLSEALDIADRIAQLTNAGVSKSVVCYMLANLYSSVSKALAEHLKEASVLARDVASRTISRLSQIEVAYSTMYYLYTKGFFGKVAKVTGFEIINLENYVVYKRWLEFKNDLDNALASYSSQASQILSQLFDKVRSVCTDT